MSFGDPNNPYGQPQAQQPPAARLPGYGYPQQAPPGVRRSSRLRLPAAARPTPATRAAT